jgi:hypothetical protein
MAFRDMPPTGSNEQRSKGREIDDIYCSHVALQIINRQRDCPTP